MINTNEYTQGYGSLIIRFDRVRDNSYLTPAPDKNIFDEVFPDAIEFVKLYVKDSMILLVNGVRIEITPFTTIAEMRAIYNSEFEKLKNNLESNQPTD